MAEVPENPGNQAPPEPPPFQPVSTQYQPVAAPSQVFAPPAAPTPLPAKSGGSGVLKIILIVVSVLVVLVMLVVGVVGYGIWRVAHAVHVNNSTGTMTINTPGGTMTANSTDKFTADELGTDLYPGADLGKSGNMRMSLPTGSVVAATFLTSDSKGQVVDFYKSKFGSQAVTMDMGEAAIVSLKKNDKDQVTVTVTQKADQFNGKTQIHIMHTTST